MGAVTVAPGSVVYYDANAFIYTVERVPRYWPALEELANAISSGAVGLVSSELIVVEALTGPLKANDRLLVDRYERLFRGSWMSLSPMGHALLRRAAELRATHGLKTPDAIHAATALAAGCDQFVTNDTAFRRVTGLSVIILDDVLASP